MNAKTSHAVAAFLTLMAAAPGASAEDIGIGSSYSTPDSDAALAPGKRFGAGTVVLSADRLFGVHLWKVKTSSGGGDAEQSGTTLAAFFPGAGQTPGQVPRLAFDWIGAQNISLGGAVGYISETTQNKVNNTSVDGPKATMFVLSPRLGYVVPMGPRSAFWPRAGITWFSQKRDQTSTAGQSETDKLTGLQVNLEAMFFLGVTPSFGFVLGPFYDLPLSGTRSSEGPRSSPAVDVKPSDLGLAVGLGGAF